MTSGGRSLRVRMQAKAALLAWWLASSWRQWRGTPIRHAYRRFEIVLPADHPLPVYQAHHPAYDRFLPRLATCLPPGATVIDVGANVGDTMAAMVDANPALRFVCVEADTGFFGLLQDNIKLIRAAIPELRVSALQALVGSDKRPAKLEGKDGSKHAVPSAEGGMAYASLDSLLPPAACSDLRLVKIDVDGFDHDVLASATTLLQTWRPLVYFECQTSDEWQRAGYERIIRELHALGYDDWTLFDNYGGLLLRTSDLGAVVQLIDYVWRQHMGRSTRTVHYLDIMAAHPGDVRIVDKVLCVFRPT